MSKEVKRLLRDRYASYDIYDYSAQDYPGETNLKKILIPALRGLQDFDTGWFTQRLDRHGYLMTSGRQEFGRIFRVGNTITCMVESVSAFNEKGLAEELLELKAVVHPVRALKAIRNLFQDAEQKADERKEQNKMVEEYRILKNGRNVQVYLVPVGKGLQMERPPHEFYDRWGFQARLPTVPPMVKKQMLLYAEDPVAFDRDSISEDPDDAGRYIAKRAYFSLGNDVWDIQLIKDMGVHRRGIEDE